MGDWQTVQQGIDIAASNAPDFAWSTRYDVTPLAGKIVNGSEGMPGVSSYQILDINAARPILASYNEAQPLNMLVYPATIMNGKANPAGGCEWQGQAVSGTAPFSAIACVGDRGSSDILGRDILHETIHCLFSLTGVPDTLHQYLEAHSGYLQNTIVDLCAVYADIIAKYNSGMRVTSIAKQAVAIVAADTNPADKPALIALLAAIGNLLAKWFKS
jgi:ribonucleotide monophosphatase NagD (HAD superfamily)